MKGFDITRKTPIEGHRECQFFVAANEAQTEAEAIQLIKDRPGDYVIVGEWDRTSYEETGPDKFEVSPRGEE